MLKQNSGYTRKRHTRHSAGSPKRRIGIVIRENQNSTVHTEQGRNTVQGAHRRPAHIEIGNKTTAARKENPLNQSGQCRRLEVGLF